MANVLTNKKRSQNETMAPDRARGNLCLLRGGLTVCVIMNTSNAVRQSAQPIGNCSLLVASADPLANGAFYLEVSPNAISLPYQVG